MNTELLSSQPSAASTHPIAIDAIPNRAALRNAAFSEYPDLLNFDADRFIDLVLHNPNRSRPFAPQGDFLQRVEQYVRALARHQKRFDSLASDNEPLIRAAIRRTLRTSPLDCGIDTEDIVQEVLLLILTRVNSLMGPGQAKQSTRVYRLVATHARYYHAEPRHLHYGLVKGRIDSGLGLGCEMLSEEELASKSAEDHLSVGTSRIKL